MNRKTLAALVGALVLAARGLQRGPRRRLRPGGERPDQEPDQDPAAADQRAGREGLDHQGRDAARQVPGRQRRRRARRGHPRQLDRQVLRQYSDLHHLDPRGQAERARTSGASTSTARPASVGACAISSTPATSCCSRSRSDAPDGSHGGRRDRGRGRARRLRPRARPGNLGRQRSRSRATSARADRLGRPRGRCPDRETVMRMLERSFQVHDPLRRRLRRVDRRAVAATPRAATGSTTSTGSRRRRAPRRTAVHQGDRIWWDLHDWSADRLDPGRRRLVPRAVRTRHRRQAVARRRSTAPPDAGRPARRSRPSSRRSASRPPTSCSAPAPGPTRSPCVVGTWRDMHGELAADADRSTARAPAASTPSSPARAGRSLAAARTRAARSRARCGAGAGLIAATGRAARPSRRG